MRVLLSTTNGWNAGDDWIREGLLRALRFRSDVDTVWWNRGWGIERTYANAPGVNLPLVDYVIMVGTPEWVDQNEILYDYAVKNDIPIALLGVGRNGCYRKDRHAAMMGRVAASGLVEVAIARDKIAHKLLRRFGIPSQVMCDPAMFKTPVTPPGGPYTVCGWRTLLEMEPGRPAPFGKAGPLEYALMAAWERSDPAARRMVVHDNREIIPAEGLFGRVRYSSDHAELFRLYAGCGRYVGARIHGFVAALIHGAPAHLIYNNDKAVVADTIIDRLGLAGSAAVTYLRQTKEVPDLDLVAPVDIWGRIRSEMRLFRAAALGAPRLAKMMEDGR